MADPKPTYSELLKDPRWQKLRLEIFNRDGWSCVLCGNKTQMLAVHHKRYVRGKKPWEYDRLDLLTLCDLCHQEEHDARPGEEATLLDSLRLFGLFTAEINDLYCSLAEWYFGLGLPRLPAHEFAALVWAIRDPEGRAAVRDAFDRHFPGSVYQAASPPAGRTAQEAASE